MPEDTITKSPALTVAEEVAATRKGVRSDRWLWGLYWFLVFIAIIELYSASAREVVSGNVLFPAIRHIGLLGLGLCFMLALQRMHYIKLYKNAFLITVVSVGMAIATLFMGDSINSATRSISLGFFSLQPSEMIKFSAALIIARLLGDYVTRFDKDPERAEEQRISNLVLLFMANAAVAVFAILMVGQGLTNTFIMVLIALALMALAGVRAKHYLIMFIVYCMAAGGGYYYKTHTAPKEGDRTETRINRFTAFLRPDKHLDKITSENAQEQYSFIAQANGGVKGVGIGGSRETSRLPLAFSDYIFAIIVEDGGLIGGLLVIGLYVAMLLRAGAIAISCKKTFPALLVLGMGLFLVCQALVHIAIVTGAAPVSGEPLPFISKGGSSVIMSSIALGVMLSVSRHAARKGDDDDTQTTIEGLVDNPTQIN